MSDESFEPSSSNDVKLAEHSMHILLVEHVPLE